MAASTKAAELGRQVAEWRTRSGTKRSDLARLVGVTDAAVFFWERGHAYPSKKNIERLAEVTGLVPKPARKRVKGHWVVGARLRALRDECFASAKDVAAFVGVSPSCIANYESGWYRAGMMTLKRLAHAFGTTVEYLIGTSHDRYARSAMAEAS